jgi:alkaline phosphatase D
MQRRHLLKLAAASAALISLPSVGGARQVWATNPFTLGIASGSPTSDAIVLWTRLGLAAVDAAGLARSPIKVTWQMAHDRAFSQLVKQGDLSASPALGHAVHAEVSGLQPDREYFYRFICGEAVSAVGRTRTFPVADAAVDKLRIAYASCQQWGNGYYSAYRHMLAEEVDLVMFLGDYMYEYPASKPFDVRPTTGGWITTLEGYRSRYALHKSDQDLQAMHAACPWIITWDDHETQNDYAATHPGNSGTPVDDFMARRRDAYQAFYEHMPVRRAQFAALLGGISQEVRVYDNLAYGRLANIYTVDNRQHRDLQACTRNGRPGGSRVDPRTCAIWNDPQRTLLGSTQEAWLNAAFARSRTTWNVIGQQSVFGPRNFNTQGGQSYSNDGWDGYPAARQRLIDSMRNTQLTNPVLLGGDVHQNWVGNILADYNNPNSEKVGVEFCGTSITSLTSLTNLEQAKIIERHPHFVFGDCESRGFGVVDITPTQMTTTLKAVRDATDPRSDAHTLARFSVPAGRAEIQKL